jgi:hypothetical protein
MNKHQRSIKPGLLAAAIAATVLVSAANGQAASGIAQDQQDQRTPIVSLTSSIGDVGAEIFDGRTQRYNFATLPKHVDNAIVYIDVDSLQWGPKRTQAALELAKDLNWVVMVESATWNVPRLHAFLAAHFPGTSTKGLQNVAVRIGWDNGRAVATDLTPSEAAVEVGIDYLKTAEGRIAASKMWRGNSEASAKARAPGSTLVGFAAEAYVAAPQYQVTHQGNHYTRAFTNDVLKIYSRVVPLTTIKECIVAWRGTSSFGDVYRDAQLQFGTLKAMQGDTTGAKFGHGYIERLKNQIANVQAVGCNRYQITGHSLGGGMAQLHAYRLRALNPVLETYNSARAGNNVFYTLMRPGVTNQKYRLFCREGDIVSSVPTGMTSAGPDRGCTYWAPRISWVNPVANHHIEDWL